MASSSAAVTLVLSWPHRFLVGAAKPSIAVYLSPSDPTPSGSRPERTRTYPSATSSPSTPPSTPRPGAGRAPLRAPFGLAAARSPMEPGPRVMPPPRGDADPRHGRAFTGASHNEAGVASGHGRADDSHREYRHLERECNARVGHLGLDPDERRGRACCRISRWHRDVARVIACDWVSHSVGGLTSVLSIAKEPAPSGCISMLGAPGSGPVRPMKMRADARHPVEGVACGVAVQVRDEQLPRRPGTADKKSWDRRPGGRSGEEVGCRCHVEFLDVALLLASDRVGVAHDEGESGRETCGNHGAPGDSHIISVDRC